MKHGWLVGIAAVLGAIMLGSEYTHWKASSRALGTGRRPPGPEVILVLGAKNRGERAHFLNRYRVRAALRSRTRAGDSTLVFCGGAVGGLATEAELMARYARNELRYRGPYQVERASLTTWENVTNAIPYLEQASVIKIVSNSPRPASSRVPVAGTARPRTTLDAGGRLQVPRNCPTQAPPDLPQLPPTLAATPPVMGSLYGQTTHAS